MNEYAIVILLGWCLCAVCAAHLGGQRNAGLAGLFFGVLFGPLGMIAAGLLDGRPNCSRCGGRQNVKPNGQRFEVCEHCGEAVLATAAMSAEDKAKDDARQQKLVCLGVLASIIAPFLFAFSPSRLGTYHIPDHVQLVVFAGIWIALFKLAGLAWNRGWLRLTKEPVHAAELSRPN